MLCVFTGPILSWSQAQLLIERGKKRHYFAEMAPFQFCRSECLALVGITGAAVSGAVTPRIDVFYIYNVSSHSSRTDRGSRSRLTFDRITWVLIQHFFNFQFQSNKHIYIHFSWPVLGLLMQCNTNLLTGEQRGESIVFLAVFIECIFCKKKNEDSTMMSVGINSHLISSALEMES